MSTSKPNDEILMRPAHPDDREFILSQIPRLAEFGPPAWRDPVQMTIIDQGILSRALSEPPTGTAVFVATDSKGIPLGFIHLKTMTDYYTGESHGHVTDIVVAAKAEGRGVGRALLAAGEKWALSLGYRLLSLSVFPENVRARELYEHLGFEEDMRKYIKVIR